MADNKRSFRPFHRASDNLTTYRLKWAAWEWLYSEANCRAIGFEVRLEGPGGRVLDVVGVGPDNRVYAIEVKASRGDMVRDDNDASDRKRLAAQMPVMNEAVQFTAGVLEAAAEYAVSSGVEELESDPAFRQALSDLDTQTKKRDSHAKRVSTFSTKFRDPGFLRTAHCHYLMTPSGLMHRDELPPFWGLLDETPKAVVEAPVKQVANATTHVLRNIARSNSTAMMTEYGVIRSKGETVFPDYVNPVRA
ncbi:MAG TPA: hypothetical protein QGI07_11110 [Dehalococcoidia bacterium]|jgi:hypothetical protein|nr:hypothetical protein [Chloroflexota bacterium]MDP5877157.1 hypothetical protein [Dehalococcoidia bacterium]MDP7161012.1 hypothetical protein [Dehalococcoidia bacterium]MDP7213935.1 hypothetical protein [Dehalococcoidia bacterium]MDP7514404.1 hypothetical protein [Dehalococcoidia bacterium]|tara:strand:+ start:748 stop:1494 length:747 start_codon:yes stop_codon:yes gene_type:complete